MDSVSIVQAAVICLVTGAVSAGVTVAAIKVDLANLRAWVKRLDEMVARAHETSIENKVRIGLMEGRYDRSDTHNR